MTGWIGGARIGNKSYLTFQCRARYPCITSLFWPQGHRILSVVGACCGQFLKAMPQKDLESLI